MSSVALALRVHAPEYLERFGDRVPLGHRKVLGCITRCRTGELGGVQFSVRLLRQRSLGRPQLWQPPLPELPKEQDIRLVGQAD
ncbi:hypothetical protein LF1_58960 [Rubripirellula obstinata]|uniref:Uncharacterized protein n=1 Tax=Rubripirellula obstinata TaxID=406547 RepID=A0A5B1CBT5_9BACT|nr:hypothetical protein LF1_58960 [Rubripirellula obstinata]